MTDIKPVFYAVCQSLKDGRMCFATLKLGSSAVTLIGAGEITNKIGKVNEVAQGLLGVVYFFRLVGKQITRVRAGRIGSLVDWLDIVRTTRGIFNSLNWNLSKESSYSPYVLGIYAKKMIGCGGGKFSSSQEKVITKIFDTIERVYDGLSLKQTYDKIAAGDDRWRKAFLIVKVGTSSASLCISVVELFGQNTGKLGQFCSGVKHTSRLVNFVSVFVEKAHFFHVDKPV